MPYKITNVSLEHQHSLKRRTAPKLRMEPIIAGKRLMLRQSIVLTDEQFEINREILAQCVQEGTIIIDSTPATRYVPERERFSGISLPNVESEDPRLVEPLPSITDAFIPPTPAPVIPTPSTTSPAYSPSPDPQQAVKNQTVPAATPTPALNQQPRRGDPRRGGR